MLYTLPNEILRVITDKLDFRDKLNLCKTCRKLHEKISTTNLYETLDVHENTEDIIRMFQNNILDGTQVQVLDIFMNDLSDELYSNLADIFPNVTRVIEQRKYGGRFLGEEKEREYHIIKPLLRWRYGLKIYNFNHDWKPFCGELFSTVFPRLENLTFSDVYWVPGRKEGFDPIFLSNGIRNAPMLTRLSLKLCDTSIDSLEEIHKGCPYLYSLEFDEVMVIVDNNVLPLSIVPAHSVSYLKIFATCFDKYGLFLDYIIHKYPNLHKLDLYIFNNYEDEIEFYLVNYYPNYNSAFPESAGEHNRICRNLLNELKPTFKAYEDGVPAFISHLPESIKVFKLQIGLFDNAIEILSKTNLAISDITLSSLTYDDDRISIKSDQLQYIKDLNSLNALTVNMNSSVKRCKVEFVSDTIVTLDVRLIGAGFSLGWILSMFPSLESLRVESKEYLLVEEKDNNITCAGKMHPKLKNLNLEECKVYLESLRYIKQILPYVGEFRWMVQVDSDQPHEINYSVYSLDLTGWNLKKVFLRIALFNDSNTSSYIAISTPRGTVRFLQKIHEGELFPVEGDSHFVTGAKTINITCDHIKCFFIDHTQINL